jgi:hypothetical protein
MKQIWMLMSRDSAYLGCSILMDICRWWQWNREKLRENNLDLMGYLIILILKMLALIF